jgi:hypothetical protein
MDSDFLKQQLNSFNEVMLAGIKAGRDAAIPLGCAIVPKQINREHHRHVLDVWNECMANAETLEMTWPKLVAAFTEEA